LNTIFDLAHIKQIVEVCLLTATNPINTTQIQNLFDNQIDQQSLAAIIQDLGNEYRTKGLELLHLTNGYRFRSQLEFQPYLNKLYDVKPNKYSRTLMEILAIIAYRQPVTRGEIEEIRGVAINSNILQILFERNWIEVVGYKQTPGKPELLATTTIFLDDLGMSSLDELPTLSSVEHNLVECNQDFIEKYDKQKELNNA